MLLTIFTTALLTFLRSPTVCTAFNIQTPNLTQCATAQLSWDSTEGPYDILIANQSNQCGYAVADLGQLNTNSATWTVALPAGWQVMISIQDGSQDDAWSAPIVIQPSSNTSCLTPELAYIATHVSTTTSSGNPANASASAAVGKQHHGDAPSAHQQIPSGTAVLLAGTIAIVAASTFFAL